MKMIETEIKLSREMFDLESLLKFQLSNDVQIIRGEDFQYNCYINKKVYATALTPLYALCYGIRCYKQGSEGKK